MAHVERHRDDIELEDPTLVEGLPGVGLVGKIAADHLVETLEMPLVATCHCEGLPEVAVFKEGEADYEPPVKFHADPEHDLLVLRSDVPVSPSAATEFADCVTGWLAEQDTTALYISGFPSEKDGVPGLYGVANGDAHQLLEEHGIKTPNRNGMVSGPTGALLYAADRHDLDALGLVVESNKNFPDPEAARVLLVDAVEPIAGVSVETDALVEQAQEISTAREELAQQMEQAQDESTRAEPIGMFQ